MTATITVHGGLTAPPELAYTASGLPRVSGTIASTERRKDGSGWKDGDSLYLPFSAWRGVAENIAASNLDKGAQVVVTGRLKTRKYDDRDGNPRTITELEVIDFAISLKWATAQVTRAAGNTSQQGTSGPSTPEPDTTDSWGAPAPYGDETPF